MHLSSGPLQPAKPKPLTEDDLRRAADARRIDMQVYDQLGPLTRAVVRECSPSEIKVGQMMASAPMECINNDGWGWDDAKLASWLRGQISRRYGKPADYFVLERRNGRAHISAR